MRKHRIMNKEEQKAAVQRCASELMRATWYRSAWKALKGCDRDDTANFVRLAEIAFGDQAFAHAIKVLQLKKNGDGEEAGFWSLCRDRQADVDALCRRLGIDIETIKPLSRALNHVRDKTHFHLDQGRIISPASPRFSPWMTTSGLRIRESYFTRTTSPEAEQAPDADTL